MKIIRVTNQKEGAQITFELLKKDLASGAKTLGLATGSTPLTFYEKIVSSDLYFSDMVSINLDEYVGLDASNNQSYAYFMDEHLFSKKPFKKNFLPNGKASDVNEEVKRYDKIIEENPIDFQILGIGGNGHIGFNEPGTSFDSTTHVVNLAENTIKANSRFFKDEREVPKQAISMGISSIFSAKTIVLMAYGESKADAILGMVKGPVTEQLPASVLQNHPNVYVVLDKEAAKYLED